MADKINVEEARRRTESLNKKYDVARTSYEVSKRESDKVVEEMKKLGVTPQTIVKVKSGMIAKRDEIGGKLIKVLDNAERTLNKAE